MTQSTTFPDLESFPTASSTAMLYFSSTMGTLTEVDLVTSGSFQSEFYAENLGSSPTTIQGTTSGNLSINVPTGAIPMTIPSVTESFLASDYDGTLNYGGTSGKNFAPVTSNSTPQTMELTSPADLAAFTGHFRLPISVTGHATGGATSGNGNLSSGFNTQTSATITVIYHYIPNLPSLDSPTDTRPATPPSSPPGPANATGSSANPASSGSSGTNAGPMAPTESNGAVQTQSTRHHARKHGQMLTGLSFHKRGQPLVGGHSRSATGGHSLVVEDHRAHDH
jgi:hypothetical protein